jgi:hypothetical protein
MPFGALAADFAKQPLSADGFNGKFETFGGSFANKSIGGVGGSVTAPLDNQFGVQFDAGTGLFDGKMFGTVAGHAFSRDPSRGLIGIYANHTYWNQFSGLDVSQIAGEGEYYIGRWTVQGIAGVEFGNSATRITATTAGTLTETYDIKTRFFDEINFAYYLTDNWKAFVGHRYLGGKNALALGTEYAFQVQPGLFGSLFVEGRLGDDNSQGVWGGVRFYFGQRDKTLMARHREDDPIKWTPSSLFSITNSQSRNFVGMTPCTPTEILIDGVPVIVCA